ncbi:MAG TPA: radical SAM protein [Candidatus Omnitrophota bacterium]|nr:radical SAM protein [Candidatus Omnitrophota bacterium]HQP11880.1 radical SAM protein [Candidatus Omnitrophota bacterium]
MSVRRIALSTMKEIAFFSHEFKKLFGRPRIDSLILYVTSRCNARCSFCFYKENLNAGNDLDLAQITRISKNIPALKGLLIGGGEPFLREDMAEIISAFVSHCRVEVVQIPTNGFLTDRIVSQVREITRKHPHLNLSIQFSLDALGAQHDAMRGLNHCFQKAEETIAALKNFRNKDMRLRILVVSVLTPETLPICRDIVEYVKKNIAPDYHWFEPVRDMPDDQKQLHLSQDDTALLRDNLAYYIKKSKGAASSIYNSALFNRMITAFSLNNFDIAYNNLLHNTPWPVHCCAGTRMAVLYPDGRLAACELRKETLNIKDFHYNIPEALQHGRFKNVRADIARHACDCTHGCFIPTSVRYSPAELLKILGRSFWL